MEILDPMDYPSFSYEQPFVSETCGICGGGKEVCSYCHNMDKIDWEVCCDCGVTDFGQHLFDCSKKNSEGFVI